MAPRSSPAIASRRCASSCIAGSNNTWRALPLRLATYMAASASRSNTSGLWVSEPPTAIPMLTRTSTWSSPMLSGSWNASCTRSATSPISDIISTSSTRSANSSPPKRATVSPGRIIVVRRAATAINNSSPTAWPRLSLTSLKSSRFMNSTPTKWPSR